MAFDGEDAGGKRSNLWIKSQFGNPARNIVAPMSQLASLYKTFGAEHFVKMNSARTERPGLPFPHGILRLPVAHDGPDYVVDRVGYTLGRQIEVVGEN